MDFGCYPTTGSNYIFYMFFCPLPLNVNKQRGGFRLAWQMYKFEALHFDLGNNKLKYLLYADIILLFKRGGNLRHLET